MTRDSCPQLWQMLTNFHKKLRCSWQTTQLISANATAWWPPKNMPLHVVLLCQIYSFCVKDVCINEEPQNWGALEFHAQLQWRRNALNVLWYYKSTDLTPLAILGLMQLLTDLPPLQLCSRHGDLTF